MSPIYAYFFILTLDLILSCFVAKIIDDAELWGTDKQAAEEAKQARKNAKRHTKDSRLPPRHKKSKASGSRSSLPRAEIGGSQGTKPLSDMVEGETSIPTRALHRPDWNVYESDHNSETWVATQLIQGLPTQADLKGAADLTSETLESCYCQGLVQVSLLILYHGELLVPPYSNLCYLHAKYCRLERASEANGKELPKNARVG